MVAVRFAHCIGVSYWNSFVAHCKIVIEEAGVLKEQVGHLLDFIVARGTLQQAYDDCNSSRANIVPPVTHALVGLLNCVSGLYSVL